MGLSAHGQRVADTDDEDGAIVLGGLVFAFTGREIRVLFFQVFRVQEGDFLRQGGLQDGKFVGDVFFRTADGVEDVSYRILEEFQVTVLGGNDFFPVPLVNVKEWRLSSSSSGRMAFMSV